MKGIAEHGAIGLVVAVAGCAWWLIVSRMPTGGYARWFGRAQRTRADEVWASRREVAPLLVARAVPGRLVLGRFAKPGQVGVWAQPARRMGGGAHLRKSLFGPGPLLATESRHSVMVIGPTQTHKTSGFAIPAILEWDGPIIAASVKSDLVGATLGWRSTLGDVSVFDPAASTPFDGDGWSPLNGCGDWVGARRMASSLTSLGHKGGLQDGEFWYAASAKLLAPLLFAAAISAKTMADVVQWVDTQETDDVEMILQRAGCREALNAARASWVREERQRSSIYTTAETVLEAFGDPEVGATAPGSGINVRRFLDGGPNSLYVCSPAHEQERLRPLFCALVEQVLHEAFDMASSAGAPLDPPLLLVLDEAANIAPLRNLDTLASTAASHGIQLVTVWQDFSQINARYGERAGTVVNNHRAKMFLSGVSDSGTLEYVSRMSGDMAVQRTSTTRDTRGSRSFSWQPSKEPLASPASIRRLPPGNGVLVYGHLPPVRVALRPWFEIAELAQRCSTGERREQ